MAKKNSHQNTPKPINASANPNYACKPYKIGAVIKNLMEEKKISVETVAQYMNVTKRTVENWYEREYLFIPDLMKLSELFQKDMVPLYRSNVPPEPDPRDEEIKKLKGYVKHLEGVEEENGILKNRLLKQEGRIEALEEQLDKKNGR